MNYLRRLYRLIMMLLIGLALNACGGSSGPSAPPAGASSSDWDSMKWDQGTWD